MTNIIEAAYEGSGCVRIGERVFDFRCRAKDRSKSKGDGYGGVMPKAARKLIGEGVDPATLVRVTRDVAKVFENATLGAWASIAVEELASGRRGIRVVKHRLPSWQRTIANSGRLGFKGGPKAPS